MKTPGIVVGLMLVAAYANATPLNIVTVAAPAINCIFNTTCKVTVSDTSGDILLSGAAGKGFLQSRTVKSQPNAPAAGRYTYQYRIDLRNAYGITSIPCVTSLAIEFGSVVSALDYNGDGMTGDQVYVVVKGGLGTVGPSSADKVGNTITFTFGSPVCAGGSPGKGDSSYFFGLTSNGAPKSVTASVKQAIGPTLAVPARAPSLFFKAPASKLNVSSLLE